MAPITVIIADDLFYYRNREKDQFIENKFD